MNKNRVDELVNTAMNRKTWREKTNEAGYFVLPYNAVYRQVAQNFVDEVEWEWYAPRGWIVKAGGESKFLKACADAVAGYEAIAEKGAHDFSEMCEIVHAED